MNTGGVRISIDRIAAAIDQGEGDAGDWSIAVVVIVCVSEHGASDGAGLLFDKVIAGIAFGGENGDRDAVVCGARIGEIVTRRCGVAIGDGVVAGRLGFNDDIVARGKAGEAVSAATVGGCR